MLDLLRTHFGFDRFRPLQEEVIEQVLLGKDTFVLMPTGGGKSLCYQLPALKLPGLTLVISPLIALMKDQVDALRANGIPAEFINSTMSNAAIERVQTDARKGKVKIIYAAPERLANAGFKNFLAGIEIGLIAIDEAHCISEWGHDFRPDYRNLKMFKNIFPDVPVMALTATATQQVREDIIAQLSLHRAKIFISSFNRPNLTYTVFPRNNSFDSLVGILKKNAGKSAIIYCFSRKDTENLAADLQEEGFGALVYHAGLANEERRINQEKYIRDEAQIMVATIAFGMGIDKPDVRLVIHYHLPKSIEGYYQETGRAGRDGLPAECILFYSYGDTIKHKYFLKQIEDERERENAYQKLDQLVEFCELLSCRRSYLLSYFGEPCEKENCEGCDICLNATEEEKFDATIISQKIISAVIRTGERFGAGYIADVLLGAKNQKIEERGHQKLSVYGIVNDFSRDDLRRAIGHLVALKLLVKERGMHPTLHLTAAGKEHIKHRQQLFLPKLKDGLPAPRKTDDLDYDPNLFEKLRALRKRLADEKNVPPFVIFGDLALRQMAAYLPQTTENFSRINGVGAEKLKQYGEIFTRLIQIYARENNQGEKNIPRRKSARQRRISRAGSTWQETKKLVLQKMPIEEIANLRGISVGTVISHLERLIAAGEEIDLAYLKPSDDRFEKIKSAFQKSGGMNLSPVRGIIGEQFSYEELRIVRLFLQN